MMLRHFLSLKATLKVVPLYLILIFSISITPAQYDIGEYSVARMWNEALLEAIRDDFARPTVHARNLFHSSTVMYDAWAIYNPIAEPYLLGSPDCPFDGGPPISKDILLDIDEAISYAAHRLLSHRFQNSPAAFESLAFFDNLMEHLSYDATKFHPNTATPITSSPQFGRIDYRQSPAALGSYIADCMIQRGLRDGSNEVNNYVNQFYQPENPALNPEVATVGARALY